MIGDGPGSERRPLPLAIVGCDFRVASSRYRASLVLEPHRAERMIEHLRRLGAADGLFDLNTCNRTEWIVSTSEPRWAADLLEAQMIERAGTGARAWFRPYRHLGTDAARHLFRVAAGRESLVVGERQIAGQIHRAIDLARQRGSSSRVLNRLGTAAGRLVRQALREGLLEGHGVGVHSLAVQWLDHADRLCPPVAVAVVGLGLIGKRIVELLEQRPGVTVTPVNRTARFPTRPLTDLGTVLAGVDVAIVATGAPAPILGPGLLAGRDRPLAIVDVGIPAQVDRDGLGASTATAGLDELAAFARRRAPIDPDRERRATALVEEAIAEFETFCREEDYTDILEAVRTYHQDLVTDGLPSVVGAHLAGVSPESRQRLQRDLQALVLDYTRSVMKTIKRVPRERGAAPAWPHVC